MSVSAANERGGALRARQDRKRRLAGGAACLLGLAVVMAAGSAAATGFYSQEQSVVGIGRAFAGEGATTGADAQWWNPATIADVDHAAIYTGGSFVDDMVDETNHGSRIHRPVIGTTGVGGDPRSRLNNLSLLPNFGAVLRLNDQWAIGIAVMDPFGFSAASNGDAWTRYQATKVRLMDIDVQPTLAWRPSHWLRLAVGFDAEYADTRLEAALPNLSPLAPDGAATVTGHGWNYGWTAGAQVQPSDALVLGLSYRSGIHHQLGGAAVTVGLLGPAAVGNGRIASNVIFNTPWMATASLIWRVSPRLTLDAQVQQIGWSDYDTVHIVPAGKAVTPVPHTGDTTTLSIGADYLIAPRWTVRAGVQYDPQAIHNSAILADGNKWFFGAGATYAADPRTSFDVSAAYATYQPTPINNQTVAFAGTPLATQVNLTGRFSAQAVIVAAALRKSF